MVFHCKVHIPSSILCAYDNNFPFGHVYYDFFKISTYELDRTLDTNTFIYTILNSNTMTFSKILCYIACMRIGTKKNSP